MTDIRDLPSAPAAGRLPVPVGVGDITAVDVPPSAVEAHQHLLDLQAHPLKPGATVKEIHDWYAAAFRDLAAMHPKECATTRDYPNWPLSHTTPEEAC